MTKKAIIVAACAVAALFANGAANWKSLDDASYIFGITPPVPKKAAAEKAKTAKEKGKESAM